MDQSQFDVGELQVLSVKIIKFILNNCITKYPIKKSDIIKHCLNGNTKIFPRAFKSACEQLEDIYGFFVNETPKTSSKSYFCTTQLPALSKPNYLAIKYRNNWTLISLALAYIFMKGGSITDRALFNFLKRFQISDDEDHPLHGNVKKKILELYPKQLYLVKTKVTEESSSDHKIMLSWGPRAELEFPKKDILDVVAILCGKQPNCFVKQYDELYGEENDVSMDVD